MANSDRLDGLSRGPRLGSFGRLFGNGRSGPRTSPWSSRNSFEESFRMLRSNLLVSLSEIEQPIVMVTSSHANEGKTVVAAKLALSFAQAGKRVVLVDLDLRNPSAHRLVDTHNEFGISDVLVGRRPLRECLQHLEIQDLDGAGRGSMYFIGTGPLVHNPAELLGSGRTARTLDGLGKQADLVLVDTPPVLPVADALVIGRIASGAVLVVEASRTAYQAVQQSKDLLIRNQTRLLGIVMNKFPARDAEYTYGYYGYGYAPPQSPDPDAIGTSPDPLTSNGSNGHGIEPGGRNPSR